MQLYTQALGGLHNSELGIFLLHSRKASLLSVYFLSSVENNRSEMTLPRCFFFFIFTNEKWKRNNGVVGQVLNKGVMKVLFSLTINR